MMSTCEVRFLPDEKVARVQKGATLRQAAREVGLEIKSVCGDKGTCGKCICIVRSGEVQRRRTANLTPGQLAEGYALACQTTVEGDLVVEVPNSSRLSQHQVLTAEDGQKGTLSETGENLLTEIRPLFRLVPLELPEPSLVENASDLSRLMTALEKAGVTEKVHVDLPVLRRMPDVLRENNWQVKVALAEVPGGLEMVDIYGLQESVPVYGLAIDIGTTTVVVQLIDLQSGQTVGVKGTYNQQARYGDDVISRIVYTEENPEGMEELQRAVVETINELVGQLVAQAGITNDAIRAVVYAGNTTMTHLFLKVTGMFLRREPYIPAANFVPPVRAEEIGLMVNPKAWVYGTPGVGSYVGGDIVSGALVTGMQHSPEITLFIDVGTNGEIVLGNQEWMLSCACSAGPAFEGAGIRFGMRAMEGAIERLEVDLGHDRVAYKTIGGGKPLGICGSGLIDMLATLRDSGVIDRAGTFVSGLDTPRIREGEDGKEYVLVWAKDSAQGKDIVITQADIKNLIRAKGAIFAGIRVLLDMVSLTPEMIDRILIAGGFGNYINIPDAVRIGLFPDVPVEKYRYIGNSSLKGARLSLLSAEARRQIAEIAQKMTYVELSAGNAFMDEFVSALFLPHTDLSLFPSIHGEEKGRIAV